MMPNAIPGLKHTAGAPTHLHTYTPTHLVTLKWCGLLEPITFTLPDAIIVCTTGTFNITHPLSVPCVASSSPNGLVWFSSSPAICIDR